MEIPALWAAVLCWVATAMAGTLWRKESKLQAGSVRLALLTSVLGVLGGAQSGYFQVLNARYVGTL